MDVALLKQLLNSVREGETSVDEALERLRSLPYEDLGFAKIDTHRHIRTGFPEVVFCQGKTTAQVVEIIKRLSEKSPKVLATRASKDTAEAVSREIDGCVYYEAARVIVLDKDKTPKPQTDKYVLTLCAGTADIPVAEEAALTAELMGSRVERLYDVGVAGLHRLLSQKELVQQANVLIAVAGMEGALASVVGGLVNKPVIAVPTSIGYGASFNGLAALLAMLNSCAAGVAVMNIDNGFGAGYFAHLVNI